MKKKACALILAIIMLFSLVGTAENGYLTISDPYYTDGTNIFDLTGLSVNLSYARMENVFQLILRAVTSYGQTAGGIEIENETVSLYADGFKNRYTMTVNDLMGLLSEAMDGQTDLSGLVPMLFSGNDAPAEEETENISLADMIGEIYDGIYKDGSQLKNAKTSQVDTFLHTGMSGFVVPIDISVEEVDEMFTQFLTMLDAQESFISALNEYYPSDPYAVQSGETENTPVTSMSIYESAIKPLKVNVKGNAYYGENDIFVEWNMCCGDEIIIPAFFEVTNTEKPSLYMNIQMQGDSDSKVVLYATVESSQDAKNDYLEIGLLNNDRTVGLITYQVYESAGMPVQDFYLGITEGNALYNFSFVNATDNETARNIHASVYLDGLEAQLSYSGAISSDYGDKNEQGTIQLATNIGVQAKVNVGFGKGSGAPVSFIPEGVPAVDIFSMNDEENTEMLLDFNNIVDALMTSMMMGVPGLSEIFGASYAEG
ncbi:MAG: hypothetical protein IKJ65_07815 [Clostridia bacterium]|nr:hypothetical protein [Clostridia bacterium]